MQLTGKNRSTRGKTCPSATLSTTIPTWTYLGSNVDLRGGRPANSRLRKKRIYWKLKEEVLDRTLWRTRFGRDYGPV
jgi:hypothetical protein